MLTPLLLLWPISLVLTWLVAQNIAGKPFDRALEYNVQALAKLLVVKNNQVQFNLTAPAREILRADDTDLIYYQVMGTHGEYLSGEHDLPAPPDEEKLGDGEVRLREDVILGEEVRVAYTWIKVDVKGATPAPLPVLVQVAETLEKRKTLATEIVKGTMVPQFVTLPLAVLLVWLALVRGIKPLAQLEKRIRARKPDDMSPLDETGVPEEVVPLVASVNDLLSRLKVSLIDAEALSGRRRAPAQDAAGRAAHAGRPGAARNRCRAAEEFAAGTSARPASAQRTPSTSCWRWRAPKPPAARWPSSAWTW